AHLAACTIMDPMLPGAGAAGGAAFGLVAFCGARLERGADLILDAIGFAERCRGADLVLTGEGRLDGQTVHGKAVARVADVARHVGVDAIAIVGSTGPGWERCVEPAPGAFLRRSLDLSARFGRERAMHETPDLLRQAAREVALDVLSWRR